MRIQLFAISFISLIVFGWDCHAQALVQKNIGATTPIAWGDYDNDGDMDLLQHNGTALSILKNNLVGTTATFVDAGITLASVNPSSVGWIDYNSDGFLDVYYVNAGNVYILVSQQGTSFQQTALSVGGENISIIADWGDLDNDGDQDFIGGGLIVKNLGNNLFEVSQRLGSTGRTDFLDFDFDGDLDFYSKHFLYKNKGEGVFELDQAIWITGNNEEYGDLLFDGVNSLGQNMFVVFYRYNITINTYINIWDFNICGGSDDNTTIQYLKVADFDNDGTNDVLVRENSTINLYSSSSTTGTGNCNNIIATLAVPNGRTEVADFDKDGDLDVFIGNNVFENKTTTTNASPSVPTGLTSLVEDVSATKSKVTLSWSSATDDKTPSASLSYKVIVKRGPYVVYTDGIGGAGNQTSAQRGNLSASTSLTLFNLPKANYTWTVQSVDAAFKTSTLAAEKPFTIENGPDLVSPLSISSQYSATYDETGDRYLLTYLKNGDVMGLWADGKTVQPTGVEFKINTTGSATSHTVGYNASKNEFMVSWLEVNGNAKKIYAKNLLSSGANSHAAKVIYSVTDTVKVFLGGDKIAVDPASGKYVIPFFQTRTDLSKPRLKDEGGPPVTYYPYSLLDVFGLRFSASGTTITNDAPKLLHTKSVPGAFNAFQNRNFAVQSAIGFDDNSKMYVVTWNFMGERLATYGQGSSGEITSILYTESLYLVVADENLLVKSENIVTDGGRNHSLVYNPISDQFIFVWSYWMESTNGSGSDDYSFEVYERVFSLNNDGTVAYANPLTMVSKPPHIIDYGSGLPSASWSRKRNEFLITWTKGIASGQIGVLGEGDLFYRRVHPFGHFMDDDSRFVSSTMGNETIVRNNTKYGHFLFGWKSGTQNQLSIFRIPKGPVPSVKDVTPNKAGAGAKIIVHATGMGNTPSLTKVYFSDEDKNEAVVDAVYPNPLDSTRIQVTVPSGLGRNKVVVRVVYDDQSSKPNVDNILFENVDNTSVTSVLPLEGTPGETITITGVNFPTVAEDIQVMFGNVQAATSDIVGTPTSTTINVKVPQAAVRGSNQPVGVVIQGVLNNYAGGTFRVIRPPVIELVKALGSEKFISGTNVLITGKDFSDSVAELTIKVGDITVSPDSIVAGNTSLIFPVPFGAEGKLKFQVYIDDRVASSPDPGEDVYLGSQVISNPPKSRDFPLTDAADTIQLKVRVYSKVSVDKINFWSKGISKSDNDLKSTSLALSGMTEDKLTHVIEEANFTDDPIGLEAYFEVVDRSGIVKKSDRFKIYKNYKSADPSNQIPDLRYGGNLSDYQIVSIPYTLSPSNIPVVFKDLFNEYGYDPAKWRILHFDPAQSKYQEYLEGLNTIEPGKGYWLIQRYDHDIFFEGARTVDVNAEGNYEIEIKQGWNQIGNPFNFNISWDDIKKENDNNNAIESFKTFKNGALVEATTIDRFRGGFVRYNGTDIYKLKIPAENKGVQGGRLNDKNYVSDLNEKEWRIALDLSAGDLKNLISSFGMHPHATNDVDEKDEHKLPAFIQSLDLSFPHSLSTSIVGTNENYSWDFELTNTTDSKEVTIRWDNRGFGENDRELFLQDNVEQRLIDMRKENHYTFVYREGYSFKLHFGDKSYIERIAMPSDVVLSDAHPNPMQSTTTIPFTVNRDKTHVHLAVYTLQGQEIQTLVNDDLSRGFYELEWDGRGPGGDPLNSGVVIYRLQTSETGGGVKSLFKKLIIAP